MRKTQSLFCVLTLIFCITSHAQQDSISILALGDSYTDGTSELKRNSWPYQLQEQLQKKKIQVKKPQVIAKPGWTTSDLLKAIESENPETEFSRVFLLIGVNNQYKGKPIEQFQQEYPLLLKKSIKFAQNKPENVVALSIPDWSVTPFARFKDRDQIVKELKIYNTIIENEADKSGVRYIDITKVSRNALVNPDWIASDSLHPSKKMYKAWVKKITKAIKLQKR